MPLIRNKKTGLHEDKDWDTALLSVQDALKANMSNPESIQVLIGQHTDLETIVNLRDFMNRLNVEDVSLGRNSLKVNSTIRSGFLMNSRIRGIEDADLLLLVGVNPRYESPVMNSRIRKAVNKLGLKVGLVGSPYDLTYDYDHLGSTTKSLLDLIEGKHPFCSKISKAKLPMILVGSSMFKGKDGAELYNAVLKLSQQGGFVDASKHWNGLNILHDNISSIGALELGVRPNV